MKSANYLAIAGFLGLVGSAQGATVSDSVNYDITASGNQYYLDQFDPSLGTLTGVTFTWTANPEVTGATITNANDNPVTIESIQFTNSFSFWANSTSGTGAPAGQFFPSAVTVTPAVGEGTLGVGESLVVGSQSYGSDSNSSVVTGDLSPYQGTGTVPFYLAQAPANSISASGEGTTNTWTTTITQNTTGTLGVQYTYEVSSIPEPSGLLSIGGLLGLSLFARRRVGEG